MFEKFSTTVLLAVGVAGQIVYPGDNCCTFYFDHYYGYPAGTFCNDAEEELIMFDFCDPSIEDKISSYWCGPNVLLNALCSDLTPECPYGGNNI